MTWRRASGMLLLRSVGQQHGFDRIVGDARGLEKLDLRIHSVALADAVEPRPGVEGFGIGPALPQIDTAGPAVFRIDELIADKPRHRPEPRRDLAEIFGARLLVDRRRQFVL